MATTFQDLKLNTTLLQNLQELNYTTPTPIQLSAIPLLLQGNDVAAQAETGSGKTAAFGLPLIQQVKPELQQIQALILVPTRELAVQLRHELKQYAKNVTNLKISAFYGGHSFSQERASLSHPPQILVATPGRLTDHLFRKTVDMANVRQLVLDEADKLLEMGFEEEIDQIMEAIPAKRQVILFSATMPQDVKDLIEESLKNPQFVKASANALPEQLELIGIKAEQPQKQETIVQLLKTINGGTVVFCNTRAASDELAHALKAEGIAARPLHGGMEQPDRDKMMTLFRNGTTKVLVATDLAARGLDIALLDTIIHYELPDDVAAYQHRSGRTGRAGKSGTVYTLATPRDERKLRDWDMVRMDKWLKADEILRSAAQTTAAQQAADFATLTINAGRKDKISPRDIVGAIIAETGLTSAEIGKIEIQDRASFVAVPHEQAQTIADKLNNGKIKGRKFRVHLVK